MSDGGPSEYYDFREGWNTWNDFADYKAKEQWKEHWNLEYNSEKPEQLHLCICTKGQRNWDLSCSAHGLNRVSPQATSC